MLSKDLPLLIIFSLLNNNNKDSNGKTYSNNSYSNNVKDKQLTRRGKINLCGIINQGATCYLNTLIQTLFLTREFRGFFTIN